MLRPRTSIKTEMRFLKENGHLDNSTYRFEAFSSGMHLFAIPNETSNSEYQLGSFIIKNSEHRPLELLFNDALDAVEFLQHRGNKKGLISNSIATVTDKLSAFAEVKEMDTTNLRKLSMGLYYYGITRNMFTGENLESFIDVKSRYYAKRKEFVRGILDTPEQHVNKAVKLFLSGIPFESISELIDFPGSWIEHVDNNLNKSPVVMTDSISWDAISGMSKSTKQ